MIRIDIPGRETLEISHVVLDYNGTVARDGLLLPAAAERIRALTALVPVYILTADTYGTVEAQCRDLGVAVRTFPRDGAAKCKREIVEELGGGVFAVGNGFNDMEMFDAAAMSVAVMEKEGVCAALLEHADVFVSTPEDALDLLLKPDRLRATLRT